MIQEISLAFSKAKSEKRALLIGFITAGYPSKERSLEIAKAMVAGGVDLIEVGFPYSDPVMDGPVIQRAAEIALANGAKASEVLELVSGVSKLEVPVVVMTYWNPIEKYGVNNFAQDLKTAGGSGLITPDLTIEEAEEWNGVSQEKDLAKIFVVAPSSTEERLPRVTENCSGFVYAASLMGVTGARSVVSSEAKSLVDRVKKVSKLPVAVGLGVSNGEQARAVAQFADGVIVGSAFLKIIQEESDFERALTRIRELAAELREGIKH